ncbi:MAG: M20/M25/M40 family metallo-hydrolase, partial [Myxococcales bacterium]|nr:M20/M25/M40 family metallo-hydrolase [Myxococcales bacterium]
MKRALKIVGAALLLVAAVLLVRAVTAESRQRSASAAAPLDGFDLDAALERLAAAIRLRTVADAGGGLFDELYILAADGLPPLARLQRRDFPLGVMFTWKGTDPTLEPLLLLAHADVVPVDRPEAWTHPPFGGRRVEGFLWGRGALDDKASLMAQLEAAAWLIGQGFQPKRTVLFAFGHDEETTGKGAAAIADHLEAEGVRAHLVLDEGGMVTQGVIPGIERPVAIVGVAEKDAFSVRLTAEDVGGHASMPPPHTAAGRVGRAVALLEANPWPLEFTPAAEAFMDWL